MTDGIDLPLAMLATSLTFRPDGTATLSGVWYLLKSKLPGTGLFSHPDLIRLQFLSGWSLWDGTQLLL
jgi:hypothetical protein